MDESMHKLENLYNKREWETLLEKVSAEEKVPLKIYYRALALQHLKKFEEALEIYAAIYESKDVIQEIDYNIGLCYYHLNRYEKAAKYFRLYIIINPLDSKIYMHTANALLKLENYREVNELCERSKSIGAKIPYKAWSVSLYHLHEYQKAHEIAIKLIVKVKTKPEPWFILGNILNSCGYFGPAEYCFKKAYYYSQGHADYCRKYDEVMTKNKENKLRLKLEPKIALNEPIIPPKGSSNGENRSSCQDCSVF